MSETDQIENESGEETENESGEETDSNCGSVYISDSDSVDSNLTKKDFRYLQEYNEYIAKRDYRYKEIKEELIMKTTKCMKLIDQISNIVKFGYDSEDPYYCYDLYYETIIDYIRRIKDHLKKRRHLVKECYWEYYLKAERKGLRN